MRRVSLVLLAAALTAAVVPWHQTDAYAKEAGTVPVHVILSVPVPHTTNNGTYVSPNVPFSLAGRRSPKVADELLVFRSPAEPGDALPATAGLVGLAGLASTGPPGQRPNLAQSRLVVIGTDGAKLYATPTHDGRGLCLELDPPSSATCGEALSLGLDVHVETSAGGTRGRVYGIAADSVTQVVVRLRDGTRLRAPLDRNGFYAGLPLRLAPSALQVTYRDGTTRLFRIMSVAQYLASHR